MGATCPGRFFGRVFCSEIDGEGAAKLKPTWRNNRSGDARVAKRIDRFLVAEQLVDRFFLVRQWVGSGGLSDHFPIFFEIKKGPYNPPSPLKFNKLWLQDESFRNLFYLIGTLSGGKMIDQLRSSLQIISKDLKYILRNGKLLRDLEMKWS